MSSPFSRANPSRICRIPFLLQLIFLLFSRNVRKLFPFCTQKMKEAAFDTYHQFNLVLIVMRPDPEVIKKFMLNLTENDISTAHKN